jgi:hypothetical protein
VEEMSQFDMSFAEGIDPRLPYESKHVWGSVFASNSK